MAECPSILEKNEQAHSKEAQPSNSKPETDTAGIVNVLMIYIRHVPQKAQPWKP